MAVPPDQMPPVSTGDEVAGANAPMAGNSPQAAPMTTPQAPEGLREAAKVDVMLATKVLERALPAFGFDTREGKAILNTLKSFSKIFGSTEQSTQELMPAEIQNLLSQMPQGAGGAPGGQPMPMPPGAGTTPPTPPAG